MTETTQGSREVSEITRADYRAITDTAYSLSFRINDLMNRLDDGPEDPAWHELHELMQLAHVLAGAAGRYADRAALPRAAVDYLPAGDAQARLNWEADRRATARDLFPSEW